MLFGSVAANALGSALGGLFSGAGSAAAGFMSAAAQRRQYEYQKQLVQQQMDFQERMSNTAHQREVKDLISAGLNPVLSATGGGASTPVGSMAQLGEAPEVTGLNSALSFKRLKNETELRKSQEDLNSAQSFNQIASGNYTSEQMHQFTEWNPKIQKANLASIIANTSKALQDIENSKVITSAQAYNLIRQGDLAGSNATYQNMENQQYATNKILRYILPLFR